MRITDQNTPILERKVSLYSSAFDTNPNPQKITLKAWFKGVTLGAKNSAIMEAICAIRTLAKKTELSDSQKNQYKILKLSLPNITPSGIFEGGVANVNLVQHSGLLAIDIDNIEKGYAGDMRDFLFNTYEEIIFSGVSASGNGVWALIEIANPEKHKEHFVQLVQDLQTDGIAIDKACSNVARRRFYSMDKSALFRDEHTVYSRLPINKHIYRPSTTPTNYKPTTSLFEQAMAYCEKRGKTFKKGDMHDSILVLCGFLIKKGISEQEADAFIRQNICNEITTNCISYPYTHWKTDFGIWK